MADVASADERVASDSATEPEVLAAIAQHRPELRVFVARNPSAYPELLTWLVTFGDAAVGAAVAARTPATSASSGVRATSRRGRAPAARRGLAIGVVVLVVAGGFLAHWMSTGNLRGRVSAATTTISVGRNPSAVAVDGATHTAYVLNGTAGTVSVIDTRSKAVTGELTVGESPEHVAIDPVAHTAYVDDTSGQKVWVINTRTNKVTRTIRAGCCSQAVAVDGYAHTAYVTESDRTVSVIDTASSKKTGSISVPDHSASLAVDPVAHTTYLTNSQDDTVSVIGRRSTRVTRTIPLGKDAQVGADSKGVAVDGAHSAYVTNRDAGTVSVIDTRSNTVTQEISVGALPGSVAVDGAAHTAYVVNFGDGTVSVIDTRSHNVTQTIAVGRAPCSVAVDPVAHTAYVVNRDDDTVSVVSPE